MTTLKTVEIPIQGMDCAECTRHVQHAIAALPGVEQVEVFLAAEKAQVRLDAARVDMAAIRQAVEGAGYAVAAPEQKEAPGRQLAQRFTGQVLTLLGIVFGAVLFIVVVGEWLGLFDALTARLPWPLGAGLVLLAGFPVFRNVARATLRGQVIAHTLMTVGVIAALVVGEWATAVVVVFFMRVGDYVERFTTERARRALRDLAALAPQTARLEQDGMEIEVPVAQVQVGQTVIVRPGEMIPVDGVVIAGQATLDQSTITGEGLPVEAGPGARVFAATLAQLGSLRVRATGVGVDTTFGRVITLVQEAEAQRGDVQRLADKFSAYYLPVVAGIAALTFFLRGDALATAAVLVVACSCAFALATPIAMLASIGAGARRGLMIKGGKYLELLDRVDTLLIDKTGTLTLGKPGVTDIYASHESLPADEIVRLAASAERYSEHPLAQALRSEAQGRNLALAEVQDFESIPGMGVRARVDGQLVEVGNQRMFADALPGLESEPPHASDLTQQAQALEAQGKTLLFIAVDGKAAGVIAAADRLRPETPQAIQAMLGLGVRHVELLTGDNERAAAALVDQIAAQMGAPGVVNYRANLLPEDKIAVVRQYQAQGHVVMMVGDGVNDAPALAQADVGVAMGAAGSDVAIQAAHIALMRDDWMLAPEVMRIARRTMAVVKMNIAFTAVYNLVGLSLAALGLLPPVLAAAAQSLPDIGILANSARLLRAQPRH